jgi:hypothetical protein
MFTVLETLTDGDPDRREVLPRSARHPTTTACPWTSFNRRPQPCRQMEPELLEHAVHPGSKK